MKKLITLKRIEQIRNHFDTVTPQQAFQNLRAAGFEAEAQHVVEQGKSKLLANE